MSKEEFEKLRKKTIKISTFTILIGVLACIVPALMLRGMINYYAKMNTPPPGSYLAAGIAAAVIIALVVFVCVRTLRGALRTFREAKKNLKDE